MEGSLDSAIAFLRATPLLAGAIALLLLYLLVRKTKHLLFIMLLGVILCAVFYLIGDLAGKGTASKTKMINQAGTQIDR